MNKPLELILKETIFSKEKMIIMNPDFLAFDNINFSKMDIAELRYGVKAIRGYKFNIGRIYCIDIKSVTGKIIKIRLKSLYRINRKKLDKKYLTILNALCDNYILDIIQNYINQFNNRNDFDILGVKFTQEGMIFDKKYGKIPWQDLGTRNYWRYCSFFSNAAPNKYKAFEYLTDWNTLVLLNVTKHILSAKKLL